MCHAYLRHSSLKTYVSVLTVSSFRPTIGRSISRSRRLVQGDKYNIIPLFFVVCQIWPVWLHSHSARRISFILLLVGATEEGQIVLVDVLGNVKTVGLDQLLIVCQLVLEKREDLIWSKEKKRQTVHTARLGLCCQIWKWVCNLRIQEDRNRIISKCLL